MAVVTSFRNFIRNLGGTLGLAISGTIINNAVRHSLSSFRLSNAEVQLLLDSPDLFGQSREDLQIESVRMAVAVAYKNGFRIVFIVGGVLNAFAFVAAWFLMPHIELSRADDEKLKEEGRQWQAEKDVKK